MAIVITEQEKQILQEVNIPPRPEVLLKISDEARKSEPNVECIAQYIAEDISISAAVLQVVNSVVYRRSNAIESIPQAVMMLGFRRIFPLVKAVALKSSICADAELDDFWHMTNTIAQAASHTAALLGRTHLVDNAYMLGLFHLSGIPMMFQAFQEYHCCYEQAVDEGLMALFDAEKAQFGTSHPTLGALVAQEWMLPQSLLHVIYNMQDTEGLFQSDELNDEALELLAILKIARRAVFEKLGMSYEAEWLQVEEEIPPFLGIDDVQLEEMLVQIQEAID